jgi:hypothetical protein
LTSTMRSKSQFVRDRRIGGENFIGEHDILFLAFLGNSLPRYRQSPEVIVSQSRCRTNHGEAPDRAYWAPLGIPTREQIEQLGVSARIQPAFDRLYAKANIRSR